MTSPGVIGIGLCSVTSLVPSGKVASTWTESIISGTPGSTSVAAQHLAARGHQLGHGPAVAGALEHERGQDGDRLRVVQLQAAAPAALGHVRGQRDEQSLLLVFGQPHVSTIWQRCFLGVNCLPRGGIMARKTGLESRQ